tara:strand:- start:453 stop:680 length:228 start_codon:yes stop_codon:yes gene_type:complete
MSWQRISQLPLPARTVTLYDQFFGSFNTQRHRIGPAFNGRFGNGFNFNLGVLIGINDVASNVDIRAALIKTFDNF